MRAISRRTEPDDERQVAALSARLLDFPLVLPKKKANSNTPPSVTNLGLFPSRLVELLALRNAAKRFSYSKMFENLNQKSSAPKDIHLKRSHLRSRKDMSQYPLKLLQNCEAHRLASFLFPFFLFDEKTIQSVNQGCSARHLSSRSSYGVDS